MNGELREQFLLGLKFIRCERGEYYRTKLYDDVFLEIDMNDSFASLVKVENKNKRHPITKICLPNKLTKERLLRLLEVMR